MANSSSAVLRQLTRAVMSQAKTSKSFSTSPVQVSLSSPFKIGSKNNCKLNPTTALILSKRNMYSHPSAMGNPYYEEEELEETTNLNLLHFEAMERWQEQAQKLYDIMDTSDVRDDHKQPIVVAEETTEQVKSLMEELIDDDLLDPRLSWTASANY